MGDVEPYEYARESLSTIIINKRKSDFIINFEKNVYNNAINKGEVKFFKKK